MASWDNGYISEINYTHGYYSELNPEKVKLSLALAGIVPPKIDCACELGIGQGLTTNIHAAGSKTRWFGNDFNPSQAAQALDLANRCYNNFKVSDASFEDYCHADDLPDFDFIALHGIWSWVSDENRKIIIDFIGRKLKVGGVLYISYNTFPGWSNFAPIRHILNQHVNVFGRVSEGVGKNIEKAFKFGEELLALNPGTLKKHPLIDEQLKNARSKNPHYLAHEYFNKDWHPVFYSEMAEELSKAKLDFATSAHYLDYVDIINMTKEQSNYLKSIDNADFRQSVRDFIVNQQFRRDYWTRGSRKFTPLEKHEFLWDSQIVLTQNRSDVPKTFQSPLGTVTLDTSVYDPILNVLGDNEPKAIGEISHKLNGKDITMGMLTEALSVLVGIGCVYPISKNAKENVVKCDLLNDAIIENSRSRSEIEYLVSPMFSGGIKISRLDMLIIGELKAGEKNSNKISEKVTKLFGSQGVTLTKVDGTILTNREAIGKEIKTRVEEFRLKTEPLLKKLQIM